MLKIKWGWVVPDLENRSELEVSPLPPTSESLAGRGVCMMSKSLEVKILTRLGLAPNQWGSSQYVCLDHDRANEICGARLDVTNGVVGNFRILRHPLEFETVPSTPYLDAVS